MTLPFTNILCRPGPSAIPFLGPDLHTVLLNSTASTFLDSFAARPHDGTIVGPILRFGTDDQATGDMAVERSTQATAPAFFRSLTSLLADWKALLERRDDPVAHATEGRWRRVLSHDKTKAEFRGPVGRTVTLDQYMTNEIVLGIGLRRKEWETMQMMMFQDDGMGHVAAVTEGYFFRFENLALEGLKLLLGLNLGDEPMAVSDALVETIVRSGQYPEKPNPRTEFYPQKNEFQIQLEYPKGMNTDAVCSLKEGVHKLTVHLFKRDNSSSEGIFRDEPFFIPLKPALRELLWDGVSKAGS